ncbi:MAG: eL20 family ribosomal protein [Desulfurococcales archaeon]|nr:eL20 family ribosomal protein [Desulfurococcales archaeon]
MSDVKVFKIRGRMLLSHDKFPEWRNFTVEVRALSLTDAVEKVYSNLGSRHKLKRYHINIDEAKEIPLDEAESTYVLSVANLEGWDES